jgi:hypothetical protein
MNITPEAPKPNRKRFPYVIPVPYTPPTPTLPKSPRAPIKTENRDSLKQPRKHFRGGDDDNGSDDQKALYHKIHYHWFGSDEGGFRLAIIGALIGWTVFLTLNALTHGHLPDWLWLFLLPLGLATVACSLFGGFYLGYMILSGLWNVVTFKWKNPLCMLALHKWGEKRKIQNQLPIRIRMGGSTKYVCEHCTATLSEKWSAF